MSLEQYRVEVTRDHFENDDTQHFSFPCCACVHRYGEDTDQPCAMCDHNANAA